MSIEPGLLRKRYQFTLDNRPAAPLRDTWHAAASDAVGQGYGIWAGPARVKLDSTQGADIVEVDKR